MLIGNIKYTKGNMDDALIWYSRAYNDKNCSIKGKILYGYLLLKLDKIDKSEEVFNVILQSKISEDEEMGVKQNLALLLWKRGKLDDSIAMLEKVFENHRNTAVYGSLGFMLILKGDLDKALKFNQEAYEYNNTDCIILDNLGQTYYLKGEYEKSKEIYEKLTAQNPKFAEAYFNYGLLLMAENENEKALEFIKKSKNYKLYALSSITNEDIESKIEEIESIL
jgi:tetratricopeptide (TPR) repeat protein